MSAHLISTVRCGYCQADRNGDVEKLGEVWRVEDFTGVRIMWRQQDRQWLRRERRTGRLATLLSMPGLVIPAISIGSPTGVTLARPGSRGFSPPSRIRVACKIHGSGSVSVGTVLTGSRSIVLKFVKATP